MQIQFNVVFIEGKIGPHLKFNGRVSEDIRPIYVGGKDKNVLLWIPSQDGTYSGFTRVLFLFVRQFFFGTF